MRCILVTGAAGFIGSHLTDSLLSKGDRVIGLDNFDDFYDPAIKRENIREAVNNKNFELIEGDILDSVLLENIFKKSKIDVVVHVAARAGVRPSIENPALYTKVNIEGTQTLLDAMKRNGQKKLVFASSSSVYGNNKKVPFSETDNVDFPISPYAATKKACELITHTYHHLFGMSVANLRFFTVYGPRQRPEMAIHKFTRLINEELEVPMFGNGKSRRDYTYIEDIIQGVNASIDKVEAENGYWIYNLGESETIELAELIQLIGETLGKKPKIIQKPFQAGDVEQTFADISHAREGLGYLPSTKIREGINKFVNWFINRKK